MPGTISDVAGVLVGHSWDPGRGSGVTVLLFPQGAAGAADIRGEAAGTRQMDSLLRPHPAEAVHALVFAGGSAFGLDSAAGAMRYLEEVGVGFPTPAGVVPIVPAAVIYDLGFGDPSFRPTADMGYAAASGARAGASERGSIGAGAGATVGKALGIGLAMKGGFGTAREEEGGEIVGACAVVNAFGDVVDPWTGEWIAGARTRDGKGAAGTEGLFRAGLRREPFVSGNTTLAAVATASRLSRAELMTVARMAHCALARTIRPVHTPMDGDVVVALSTGLSGRKGNVMQVAVLGIRALEKAVLDGIRSAEGTPGTPSARDFSGRGGGRDD